MKTKIHLIAAFLLLGIYAVQAQEWGYVNTLTGEYMRKIWTQGLDTVYIVGENGLIAHSTDQGETWGKQYFLTGIALNDIIFTDYYTGFTVGEQGAILKTTDAGETWKQIPIAATSNLNAIAATGLDNIWAVGDNSLILHSTDAGETWERVNILPETNIQLTDIAFRGNLGYLTGNYGTIYKTEDFGVTWNKESIADYSSVIYSINITENNTYLKIGGSLYLTKDQINWIYMSYFPQIFLDRLFFLDDSIGYSSMIDLPTSGGDVGKLVIMKTSDSGKDWEKIKDTVMCCYSYAYPSQIKMVNDTLGYAIFSEVLLKIPAPLIPDPQGIKKNKNDNNLILTQPTKDELLLQSNFSSIVSVELIDTSGNCRLKKRISDAANNVNLNIGNLLNGVYLVKVIYDNNTVSIEKFIKK